MGGKGHSDHSEGKEVSDGTEKAGSDGSEGSEAQEKRGENVAIHEFEQMVDIHQIAIHYKEKVSPLSVFQL